MWYQTNTEDYIKVVLNSHDSPLNENKKLNYTSDILQMILLADDTNLFAFHRDLETLVELVNR